MGSGDGLGGCHACIKYLMFAFNFIFWLIGCALVGVGIWVLVDDSFKQLAGNSEFAILQYGGIALTVVGGIIMFVGFFGCCGAIRESQCLLVMFFICMFILFGALVTGGVICLIRKDIISDKALDVFGEGVDEYYKSKSKNELVDLVQKFFVCCGVVGSINYIDKGFDIPSSCPTGVDSIIKGCETVVPEKLDEHVIVAAGIALGAAAVMLLGMIFSMLLCCAIRDDDR